MLRTSLVVVAFALVAVFAGLTIRNQVSASAGAAPDTSLSGCPCGQCEAGCMCCLDETCTCSDCVCDARDSNSACCEKKAACCADEKPACCSAGKSVAAATEPVVCPCGQCEDGCDCCFNDDVDCEDCPCEDCSCEQCATTATSA